MLHKHSRRLPCGESLFMLIIPAGIKFEIESGAFEGFNCMLTIHEKLNHCIFHDSENASIN
jgi:hypothetical protein